MTIEKMTRSTDMSVNRSSNPEEPVSEPGPTGQIARGTPLEGALAGWSEARKTVDAAANIFSAAASDPSIPGAGSPMDELPAEVHMRIAKHLDPADLMRLTAASPDARASLDASRQRALASVVERRIANATFDQLDGLIHDLENLKDPTRGNLPSSAVFTLQTKIVDRLGGFVRAADEASRDDRRKLIKSVRAKTESFPPDLVRRLNSWIAGGDEAARAHSGPFDEPTVVQLFATSSSTLKDLGRQAKPSHS